MEQKYKIIKETTKFAYEQIKEAENTLIEMREKCDHPETELCTYSTRPGQYWDNTEICSICGEVVKWPYDAGTIITGEIEQEPIGDSIDDVIQEKCEEFKEEVEKPVPPPSQLIQEGKDPVPYAKDDELGWLANRNHG